MTNNGKRVIKYTSSYQETILQGLEEVNNILYFNQKPTKKIEESIRNALKVINKEHWLYPSHKRLCRQKLEKGLRLLYEKQQTRLLT